MDGLIARARSFWRGLRRPERLEAEMDEEMRFHLEMEAERLAREHGLDPHEARRRAAVAFGGVEKRKEEGRDARGVTGVSGMALDFKLGVRMLAKNPGITLVGGVGLAVGIAISAVVFSVLGTMMDPALPLDEGDRIVAIDNYDVAGAGDLDETLLHDLPVWREELGTVRELGAFREVSRNVAAPDGPPEPVRVAEMTASGFRIARVPPLMGRWLVDEDERPGALPVVVIRYELWRERFAGRPDVVGQTLRLGGEPHTVVGVMPEGFGFPVNNRVWAPLRLDPLAYEPGAAPPIDVFGRLAPGATLERAQAQLTTIGQRLAAVNPAAREHLRPTIMPYTHGFAAGQLAWVFHLVRLFVGILLVVIAVNVAVLVYARTATRTGEIAVRMALGASRTRVVAQLFAEALVLSAGAAVLGVVLAHFALRQLVALGVQVGSEQVPFWWEIRLSASTMLYVAGLTVLATAVVGAVPALKATGGPLQGMLRELGGGTGMRMGKTWTVLIAVQVAIALALMPVAAALPLARVLAATTGASNVPLGEILTARLALERDTPPAARAESYERERTARFARRRDELVRRLEAEPGVQGLAFSSDAPGGNSHRSIEIAAGPGSEAASGLVTKSIAVGPGLFELFAAERIAGRDFLPEEMSAASTAAIVSRSFVEVHLDGGEALGRRFRYPAENDEVGPETMPADSWYEIVGVVSDFPGGGSGPRDRATVYHPMGGVEADGATLLVRARGVAPQALAGRLREIVTAVDPKLSLSGVSTMTGYMRMLAGPERLMERGVLALVGSVLLLSAAGMHALVSLTVSQRRREIGIRIALGARPAQVLRTVLARALRQIALGLGAGGLVAAMLIPAITRSGGKAAMLLAAVTAIMLGVGLLAVIGPARRGLLVPPMEALREE